MLTLEEAGQLAGRYRWLEMCLFETLGRWVPSVPELDVKLRLADHASQHGWHSELWLDRLPRLAGVDRDQLTAPGRDELAEFIEAVGDPEEPGRTIEKLVGVYRVVVPRLVVAYTSHLRLASPLSDGPTIRCLQLILRDELDHWTEGERLLQSLLDDGADAGRAAAHQARLEGLLIGAGGIGVPSGKPFGAAGLAEPGGIGASGGPGPAQADGPAPGA
jgi:hypothetical protein